MLALFELMTQPAPLAGSEIGEEWWEARLIADTTRAPRGVGNAEREALLRHALGHNPRPSRGRKFSGGVGVVQGERHSPRPSRGRKSLSVIILYIKYDTTRAPRGVGNGHLVGVVGKGLLDTTRAPRGVGNAPFTRNTTKLRDTTRAPRGVGN